MVDKDKTIKIKTEVTTETEEETTKNEGTESGKEIADTGFM